MICNIPNGQIYSDNKDMQENIANFFLINTNNPEMLPNMQKMGNFII